MPSPMVRKIQQVSECVNLSEKVYIKMNAHDRRIFVRGLSDALALKMSPADRDEWIEKMKMNIESRRVSDTKKQ